MIREYLPDTFLNIRLSPVEISNMSEDDLSLTIERLVRESGNPYLTGVCCINMDDNVSENKISTIFKTVEELKRKMIGQL